MKKWILLFLITAAGGLAGYLDYTGQIDLRAFANKSIEQATELAENFAKDEAKAAAKTDASKSAAQLAPAVSIAVANPETFVDRIMVTGSLVAREQILIAPEVEGPRIVKLEVEVGDTVEEGQLLAKLEQESMRAKKAQQEASLRKAKAAIAQAESSVEEAESTLKEARAQLKRAQPLVKKKHLSGTIFDQRQAAVDIARARLVNATNGVALAQADEAQINAQLRELDWNLSRTEIRAPASGLITRRNARIGDVVSGSKNALFHLAKDAEIELEATVVEPKLARMSVGQQASVSVFGAGDISGKVRLISAEIDPTTRLGTARIFLGDNPALKIGAFGRATIITRQSEGLSVPVSAVLYDDAQPYVQKVEAGKVKSIPVTLGLADNQRVEITSGLHQGDEVVAKSGTFLRNGDAVRPAHRDKQVSEIRE
ncbi:MAG: efflux RND transporter periplasmic adaptor subunit [Filomicrobium sp.]